MVSLGTSQWLIWFIISAWVYLVTVVATGWYQGWVAYLLGDSTAIIYRRSVGFWQSYIDPLGMFFYFVFGGLPRGFGWGAITPINPLNITYPMKSFKLLFVFLSRALGNFCLAAIALFLLVLLVSKQQLTVCFLSVMQNQLDMNLLSSVLPGISSFSIAAIFFLLGVFSLNVLLAAFNFLIEGFRAVMVVYMGGWLMRQRQNLFIILAIQIALIWFFINDLERFIFSFLISFIDTIL